MGGLHHPSSSLPALRGLGALDPTLISRALRNLRKLYCPLPTSLDFRAGSKRDLLAVDSGYVSENDPEDDCPEVDEGLQSDIFERDFAVRWLTGFVGSAYELSLNEDATQVLVEEACSILEHLTQEEGEVSNESEDLGMTRKFTFSPADSQASAITVELYDTPMQTGEDHTDVGLQTWGASIALSEKITKDAASFGFNSSRITSGSRIVELGAGTGLVSLFLSRLLPSIGGSRPTIIATDYHPTVLSNLEANIASHMAKNEESAPVQACHLDWTAPSDEAPLDVPADMLIAADVTYAPEHAVWLRDCALFMLADNGVFWLMDSLRSNGKFADMGGTVEAAFQDKAACTRGNGRVLSIRSIQRVEKRGAVGRTDEVGYKLFEIIWA